MFSSESSTGLGLIFRSLIPFESFLLWCEAGVQFHSRVCTRTLVPAPLLKETLLSTLMCPGTLVETNWTPGPMPSTHTCMLVSASHWIGVPSVRSREIGKCGSCNFVLVCQDCSRSSRSVESQMNFRVSSSICAKLARTLTGWHRICTSIWGRLPFNGINFSGPRTWEVYFFQ